jgi:hypothetical protein
MKPIPFFSALGKWAIRMALIGYAFLYYLDTVIDVQLDTLAFYQAFLWCLTALTLLLGGIFQRQKLTVLSALVLSLLIIYSMVSSFNGIRLNFVHQLLLLGGSLLFLGQGNK